ncbi:MAG: tetratricopeptide repeat protein [Aestuariibaculum sp.]
MNRIKRQVSTTVFMLFTLIAFSQSKKNQAIIDSIHKNILKFNNTDSTVIANAHFNLGEVYRYSFIGDSAYFHYYEAEKIYKNTYDNFKLAQTLYGIAVIQCNEKDLTGSELTSIEAVSLLENLTETNKVKALKSFLYNNLGLVFGELEQYEEAEYYYKESIALKEELGKDYKTSKGISMNNLALSYKKAGKYKEAIGYFNQILKNKDLVKERSDLLALALNNYAHCKFLLNDFNELPQLYYRALRVVDSINTNGYNSIIVHKHLAEYYKRLNKIDSAKYYAYRARSIAEKHHNDELLSSLLLLSNLEKGEKSSEFLRQYIALSDSMLKKERSTRNKFARIQFETQKIEKENVRIAKERLWLFVFLIVLIITTFLIYLVITQRKKNIELEFVQEQQKTNEEIYNLMLGQNEQIEQARTAEKKRISEELHDGILGRLFGTRLSLDSLNTNNSKEAIATRNEYIAKLKVIETDIRKVSHKLNADFVSGSGFMDIIRTLLDTQTSAYNLSYMLDYEDVIDWDGISNKTKIHIYRILQETLHNIYKHAKASKIDISIKPKKNVIYITIIDNGVGFDINKAKTGIGLKNITSRIKEIEGKLSIQSEENHGTKVIIEVPV